MKNHAHRQYIQLCLFPDWQWPPRRSPIVTEAMATADDKQSFVKRHHWFVQGWRAHDYQLRLFSPDE